jgi:cell division cycle 14
LNFSVEQAYAPFIGDIPCIYYCHDVVILSFLSFRNLGIEPPFTPFRDAGFCINTFPVTVLDCARAMHRAKSLNHFNYKTFSLATFQNLAKLQNGDISWIVPSKFIAFSGPVSKYVVSISSFVPFFNTVCALSHSLLYQYSYRRRQSSTGEFTLSPEEYVPVFKNLGVTCVVRFNSKCYDRNVFVSNGIR